MPHLEIDDQTAQVLRDAAQAKNMTVAEFVRFRLLGEAKIENTAPLSDFDSELDELIFAGPSLPADFSREDIYGDDD